MDLRKLKTLVDLVAEAGITELEVTEADGKVRIVKNPSPVSHAVQVSAPISHATPMLVSASAVPSPTASAPAVSEPAVAVPSGHLVKAPMVGMFYRASAPGAKAFVNVGDTVKVGQPLCIIEAMKVLNEIDSEFAGVVKEISVENGHPVEFGQTLMVIEPAA